MSHKDLHTRSENISLGGILLSSASLIPEGSAVEVAVGVENLPDPGILLNARGRVLRVESNAAGEFTVAIKLDRSFELPIPGPPSHFNAQAAAPHSPPTLKRKAVFACGPIHSPAWHTET
jgi:hypothetical protein